MIKNSSVLWSSEHDNGRDVLDSTPRTASPWRGRWTLAGRQPWRGDDTTLFVRLDCWNIYWFLISLTFCFSAFWGAATVDFLQFQGKNYEDHSENDDAGHYWTSNDGWKMFSHGWCGCRCCSWRQGCDGVSDGLILEEIMLCLWNERSFHVAFDLLNLTTCRDQCWESLNVFSFDGSTVADVV